MDYEKKIETNLRSVWEDYPITIQTMYKLGRFDEYNCPHVITKDGKRYVPRVIVAINEGGGNTTGVCLDCLKSLNVPEETKEQIR